MSFKAAIRPNKFMLLTVIGLLVLLALVLGAWHYLQVKHRLAIKQVNIIGRSDDMAKSDLTNIIMPLVDKGWFNLDKGKIQHQLKARYPSLRAVRINMPNWHSVDIYLQHFIPAAKLPNNTYLSLGGQLYQPRQAVDASSLPLFASDPKHAGQWLQHYYKWQAMVRPLGLEVTAMEHDVAGWRLTLNHNIAIRLGRQVPDQRLQLFCTTYPQLKNKSDKPVNYIDLRYHHGFAAGINS